MTKRTATYVPPEPTQKSFNADLRTWLESIDRKSRKWARQTTIAANGALWHLYAKHRLPPHEILALLERQKRFALFAERNREQNPAASALAESVKRFSAQPEYASILRYFGVDIGQTERNLPHRPRDEWTERVVPLVSYFLEHTGKPLWKYAGSLLAAAFPEFRASDIRESVKKRVKRFHPSDDDGPPVPPLHKIVGRDARRAAVKILGDNARDDALAIEIAEINRKIKEGLAEQKVRKKKSRANKPRRSGCDFALCQRIKKRYEDLLADRLRQLSGREINRARELDPKLDGFYFVCVQCMKVCHDRCDSMVEEDGIKRCAGCSPQHKGQRA